MKQKKGLNLYDPKCRGLLGLVPSLLCIATVMVLLFGCGGRADFRGTNDTGEVVFQDRTSEEKVIIKVFDKRTMEPVQDIKVLYESGEGFEVFTAVDPEGRYLPAISFYAHNSEHVIKMERTEDFEYTVEEIRDQEQIKIVMKWASLKGMHSVSQQTYLRTIDSEEYAEIGKRTQGITIFLLKRVGGVVMTILKNSGVLEVAKMALNQQLDDIIHSGKRFDEYELAHPDVGRRTFYMESQAPEFTDLKVTRSEDTIKLKWDADDPIEYSNGLEDPTRYLGKTRQSDLEGHYRIISRDNRVLEEKTFTGYEILIPRPTERAFIDLTIVDEVGNETSRRIATEPDKTTLPWWWQNQVYDDPIAQAPELRWKLKLTDEVSFSLILINDGMLFTSGLKAQNLFTGKTLWQQPNCEPLAVGGSVVLANRGLEELLCYDAQSGVEKWKFSTISKCRNGSRIAITDQAVFVLVGSALYALDLHTGKVLWNFATSKFMPHIAIAGKTVLVNTWNDGMSRLLRGKKTKLSTHLYALNTLSGKLMWQAEFKNTFSNMFYVIDDSRVFCDTGGNGIYIFNVQNGQKTKTEQWFNYSWVIKNDILYRGNRADATQRISAYSLQKSNQIWKSRGTLGNSKGPTRLLLNNRTLFFADSQYLYGLDSSDGNEIWKYKLDQSETAYHGTPTVRDGVLYFLASELGEGTYLYCFY